MKRAILSLLFISFATQAAMVLPPDISTTEQQAEFAKQIIEEMPTLPGGGYQLSQVQSYVANMQRLLFGAGRGGGLMSNADFKKWAEERPDLKTYRFYTFETEQRQLIEPNEEFLGLAWEYFETHYARFANKPNRLIGELQKRINELNAASLRMPSNALMAGLGSLFSNEQRREILSQKNIYTRAEALRAALQDVSLAQLREKFQSERFGIERAKLTKAKALKLLDESVDNEVELIQALTVLEVYTRSEQIEREAFNSENVTWFASEDPAVLNIFADYKFEVPIEHLAGRFKAIAKNSFAGEERVVTREKRGLSLIIRELPPHLAVFRSCPSGDCSTGSSWAYPFSPKERNFYVYLEQDPFNEIGYLSGNMTEVKGKTAFFLRDMTGKKMSPDHIDVIIRGFAQVFNETGGEIYTIAHPRFHNAQNHFSPLYQRIQSVIDKLPNVEQTFLDAELRSSYIGRVVSTTSYDSPSQHRTVKLWDESKINSSIPNVGAERVADDFIQAERSTVPTGKGILRRIEMALMMNSPQLFPKLLNGTSYADEKFQDVARRFMNTSQVPVKDYYATMARELEGIGLKLTQSVIRDYPGLFLHGHLNAKDAYNSTDPEVVNQTYDILIERWLRFRDRSFLSIAPANRDVLFKHPSLIKAARQFIQRRSPADIERINEIWNGGFRFNFEMNDAEFSFLLNSIQNWNAPSSQAMVEMLKARSSYNEGLPEMMGTSLIAQIGTYYNYQPNGRWYPQGNLKIASDRAFELAEFGVRGETNLKNLRYGAMLEERLEVRLGLAIAYLRSGYEAGTPRGRAVLKFAEENLDKGSQKMRKLGAPVIKKARQMECETAAATPKKKKAS